MTRSDDCASGLHDYCGPCECNCHGPLIDKETAEELLLFIKHQYIKPRYIRVHELVKKLYEFTGS